jgi:hypothetical protein
VRLADVGEQELQVALEPAAPGGGRRDPGAARFPCARAAAEALAAGGVTFARLALDQDDAALSVNTIPEIIEADELESVAARLAEDIHARVRPR